MQVGFSSRYRQHPQPAQSRSAFQPETSLKTSSKRQMDSLKKSVSQYPFSSPSPKESTPFKVSHKYTRFSIFIIFVITGYGCKANNNGNYVLFKKQCHQLPTTGIGSSHMGHFLQILPIRHFGQAASVYLRLSSLYFLIFIFPATAHSCCLALLLELQ